MPSARAPPRRTQRFGAVDEAPVEVRKGTCVLHVWVGLCIVLDLLSFDVQVNQVFYMTDCPVSLNLLTLAQASDMLPSG